MCCAHAYASVLFSPSPLKALRERGIKGVRVPFPGRRIAHPEFLEEANHSLPARDTSRSSRSPKNNPDL